MKSNYLKGCDFELKINTNLTEKAVITRYDHLRQKCLLSSSLSNIHDNTKFYDYKIINKSTNNKIHIPFNNDNYKYIGMYLEHVNSGSNNLEDRFRLITNYDSENNLLELENEFTINKNINNLYRIRKELPLAMGFGTFNNIRGQNGIKYVNKKGATNIEIINSGSNYREGDICTCVNNSNSTLEIEITKTDNGKIVNAKIINPGDNWNINDIFNINSRNNNNNSATGKILDIGLCVCLYDMKNESNSIIGNIYNNNNLYLYITNQIEESKHATNFYNNVPLNYTYMNNKIKRSQDVVQKITKCIFSDKMKWVVINNNNPPEAGDSWEIHKISNDGFSNILTNNSKNFINECFSISLIKLILPNIKYKNKGYVFQLPYVYVRIQKNKKNNNFLSNNPNSSDILFKASIDDCKGDDVKFIKLSGSGMTQNIYLSYNEELVIQIVHFDGTILLSNKIDHIVPYMNDDLLQMSLLFEIKKIN